MPRRNLSAPPLVGGHPRFRPVGRVIGSTIRPMPIVPGAEHPWVRMGDLVRLGGDLAREELDRGLVAQGLRRGLGALSQEELDRGQVILDHATGVACVVPGGFGPHAIPPWYVNLRPSGSRGVPLTQDRFLEVREGATPSFSPEALTPPAPATNLTSVWPQLYPPGHGGGERPRTVASATVNIGAGATVDLITLAELGRGTAAVIKKFGQTANDFTNLTWSFIVKGATVEPISGINFQFGQLFLPVDLPGTGVELGPGDDFVVRVTNTGGAIVNNVRARVDLYEYRVTG